MADVYRSVYTGEFCDDSGEYVYISLNKRMSDSLPVPFPEEIIFSAPGNSPIVISYPDKSEYKLEPINGSECSIGIKAIGSFELSNLYTSDEREWQVQITGAYKWTGFIIPDSCSEPFASKPYDVSISATDALGTLDKIPFENADGTKIKGNRSDREVLSIALAKTGLSLGMVIGVNLYETTMTGKTINDDPLSQSFIDCQRFIDEDNSSFSCEEVIRSILARYSSRIRQSNNEWQIIRAPELETGPVQARRFLNNGSYSGLVTIGNNVTAGGSDRELRPVGDTYFAKAFLASTAYYQYGYIGNALINGNMDTWSTNPSGLPDGWIEFGSSTVDSFTETRMFNGAPTTDHFINMYDAGPGGVMNTNQVQVRANEVTKVSFDLFSPETGASALGGGAKRYISVLIQDDQGKYYTNTGWGPTYAYYVITKENQEFRDNQLSLNFDVSPQSIDFKIQFGILPVGRAGGDHYRTRINNVSITPGTDAAVKPPIGIYNKQTQQTAQTYTQDPVLLLHGDDLNLQRTSLIYINGLPSQNWIQSGVTKTLLQWAANSELKLHAKPYRIFEAEFYGYGEIDPNTILSVDLLDEQFIFLSGDFDLKQRRHRLKFAQILDYVPTYIEVQSEDYGNETNSDGVSVGSPSGVDSGTGGSYVDLSSYAKTTDLPVKANNTETQTGTDDTKFITPLKLANWWSYIKGLAQTISGVWNFTARPTYNGGNLLIASDIAGKADTSTVNSALDLKAPINNPTFTGNPQVPDQLVTDNDQSAANTKFVKDAISAALSAFKGSDNVLNKSANYTVLMADFGTNGHCTVYVDTTSGNISITLPNVTSMNGYTVNVIKTTADLNSVMIVGTINGLVNDYLSNQFDAGVYRSNSVSIYKFL